MMRRFTIGARVRFYHIIEAWTGRVVDVDHEHAIVLVDFGSFCAWYPGRDLVPCYAAPSDVRFAA